MKRQKGEIVSSKARDIFTDREEPRKAFEIIYKKAKDEIGTSGKNIITYYGMGGQGKTELCLQIQKQFLSGNEHKFAFVKLQNQNDLIECLEETRNVLSERYKFKFERFDIALISYRKKSGIDINNKVKTLFGGSKIADHILNFVTDFVPMGNTVSGLAKHIDELVSKKLFNKESKDDILEIVNESPSEILSELPRFFANDLSENTKSLTEPFVFFVDTYERMTDPEFAFNEKWLNDEEDGIVYNSKNILWVFTGRNHTDWENDPCYNLIVEQHILNDLHQDDSREFLSIHKIPDELIDKLVQLSKGVPLFLDLIVSRYRETVKNGNIPKISDFGKNPKKLVEIYVGDKRSPHRDEELYYIVSCLDYPWNKNFVEDIILTDNFNVPVTTFRNFLKDTVISELHGNYAMHDFVREVLYSAQRNKIQNDINEKLIDYYDSILSKEDTSDLDYADSAVKFIHYKLKLMSNSSKEDLVREFENLYEASLNPILEKLKDKQFYDQIVTICDEALLRNSNLVNSNIILKLNYYLCYSLHENKFSDEAFDKLSSCLFDSGDLIKIDSPEILEMFILLSKISYIDKEYETVRRVCEKIANSEISNLDERGEAYLKLANSTRLERKFSRANQYYQDAISCLTELSFSNWYFQVRVYRGFAWQLYQQSFAVDEPMKFFEKTLNIIEWIKEKSIVYSLQNMEHEAATLVSYSEFLKGSDPEKSLELVNKSILIRRELVDNNPNKYLGSLAVSLSECASTLNKMESFEKALPVIDEAIKIREKLYIISPKRYNFALANSYMVKAKSYLGLRNYVDAEPVFERTIALRRNHLERNRANYSYGLAVALMYFGECLLRGKSDARGIDVVRESLDFFQVHKDLSESVKKLFEKNVDYAIALLDEFDCIREDK
jgi:tetratricopeptide (TPR) repeat protein